MANRMVFEAVLRGHLPHAPDRPLAAGDVLAELGLDSLELIHLLLDIESSFNISFPDERLDASTFSTVGALESVVTELVRDQLGEPA